MKFKIEIDDFWLDEDTGSLEDELKSSIKNEIVREIKKFIQDEIEIQIKDVVQQQISDSLTTEISMLTRDIVSAGTVKSSKHSEDRITIKDLIISTIEGNRNHWSNPIDELQKYANKHMAKIKSEYDYLFASSIVKKMAEQGMLKDDNINKLLNKEK